jgi:hypothetical protein
MKSCSNLIYPLTIALALAGCAADGNTTKPKVSTPGVQTEEKAVVTPSGEAAGRVTINRITATVRAINLDTRMVSLQGPGGELFTFQAGDQVRNLAQVQVGDKVTVEYYDGLVADLKSSATGQSGTQFEVTEAVARAALGERPAGAVGKAVSAMVTIQYVDTLRNVVHFKDPIGDTHIVKVMKPEFRTMLKNLKVGDQVSLTFFRALVIAVTPVSN